MRAALSNALVALNQTVLRQGADRGEELHHEYVSTVLEGGLTVNEETLLAAGKADVVREYRLTYQRAVEEKYTLAVERITGRRVRAYHSQVVFDPPRSFEMFVLDLPPFSDPR